MAVIDRRRVRQAKSNVVIVHRREGTEPIRSKYDIEYGYFGKWGTVCGCWTTVGVNTTTDDNLVTCMRCLARMEANKS